MSGNLDSEDDDSIAGSADNVSTEAKRISRVPSNSDKQNIVSKTLNIIKKAGTKGMQLDIYKQMRVDERK